MNKFFKKEFQRIQLNFTLDLISTKVSKRKFYRLKPAISNSKVKLTDDVKLFHILFYKKYNYMRAQYEKKFLIKSKIEFPAHVGFDYLPYKNTIAYFAFSKIEKA